MDTYRNHTLVPLTTSCAVFAVQEDPSTSASLWIKEDSSSVKPLRSTPRYEI